MPKESVLAIFAHPDDAELVCFGTLSLLAERGYDINIYNLSDGKGSISSSTHLRAVEAKCAAEVIGADLRVGPFHDGYIQVNRDVCAAVGRELELCRPAIVITHYPEKQDHQDHEATGRTVTIMANRSSCVRAILQAEPPLTSNRFSPNLYVDVSRHMDRKLEAIQKYESESFKVFLDPHVTYARARWWALRSVTNAGLPEAYCEAFVVPKMILSEKGRLF
jgi:N-acetylglucosamine malate deacetylase 1